MAWMWDCPSCRQQWDVEATFCIQCYHPRPEIESGNTRRPITDHMTRAESRAYYDSLPNGYDPRFDDPKYVDPEAVALQKRRQQEQLERTTMSEADAIAALDAGTHWMCERCRLIWSSLVAQCDRCWASAVTHTRERHRQARELAAWNRRSAPSGSTTSPTTIGSGSP
jgi:hypothetical protein